MIVGINALSLKPGYGGREIFFQNVLRTFAEIQPQLGIHVFCAEEMRGAFKDWPHTVAETPAEVQANLAKTRVDVLISPMEAALAHAPVPQTILVMDLEGYSAGGDRKWRWMRGGTWKHAHQACMDATSIIAPSDFVKRQLLDVLEAPMEKVIVAHLGVDPVFEEPQTAFVEAPYLLTVGATHKGRNVPMLMAVMKKLWEELPHSLVVVGRPGEDEPDDWGPRVMRVESAPRNQLAALYQHCELTVLPSPHAGSAITVLEAMRAGSTVICARTGGIPESAHTAPIYFNPENAGNLVAAIRRGLGERASERKTRHNAGRKLAHEYTWEACAWKVLNAIKRK